MSMPFFNSRWEPLAANLRGGSFRELGRRWSVAVLASALVHVLAVAVVAAWWPARFPPPLFEGRQNRSAPREITLEFSEEAETPETLVDESDSHPVLIRPQVAEIDRRVFLDQPPSAAQIPTLSELLAELQQLPEPLQKLELSREETVPGRASHDASDDPMVFPEVPPPVSRVPAGSSPSDLSLAEVPPVEIPAERTESESSPGARPELEASNLGPPTFVYTPLPRYPAQATRNGWQGVVLLRLVIDVEGRVAEVRVIKSSGYPTLDAAAVQSVRAWKARRTLRNGKPIERVWDQPVRFRL